MAVKTLPETGIKSLEVKRQERGKLHRAGLFALFLFCGLSIWVSPTFIAGYTKTLYLVIVPASLLVSVVLLRRNEHLKPKYFQVFFAFFIASFANSISYYFGGGTTVEGKVFNVLVSTLLIVPSIILLTKISGNDMSSIYLKRGKMRLGIVMGVATLLVFLLTSVQAGTFVFGGRNLSFDRLISWAPLLLAFVFANGLREEIWFRGLFLKKYESFLGAGTANFLQAIIFSAAHSAAQLTPIVLVLFVVTFFFGLAFGAVMQKTDSVLGSILFHAGSDIPFMLAIFSMAS